MRPPRGWTRSPRPGCTAPPGGCCGGGSASSSRTACRRCAAATRSWYWPTARSSRPGRCGSRSGSRGCLPAATPPCRPGPDRPGGPRWGPAWAAGWPWPTAATVTAATSTAATVRAAAGRMPTTSAAAARRPRVRVPAAARTHRRPPRSGLPSPRRPTRRRCRKRPARGPCARSSGSRRMTPGSGSARWRCSCAWSCSAWTVRYCRGCGPTWWTAPAGCSGRPPGSSPGCWSACPRRTTPGSGSRSGGSARCCGSACAWCTGRPGPGGSARIPRSRPSVTSGLLPIGAWALYLSGWLSPGATLVAVSTLGAARWFAWTTASLVSQLPSARVWTRRTVAMSGAGAYSAAVPGVDLSAGAAPAPAAAPRHPLRRLELTGFSAVHEDGTIAARDIDLAVERGQLVLVVGPVGSGKSSLLRALAGIVHHTGALRWNGQPVTQPELFLRPNQVGYVAQLPRVLSGTVADNIRLGHEVDAADAVSTAQLEHDLAAAGSGLGLLIGHKGTRLSGGQLQRLALARALAPRTELLIADDVSSALDVTTELELWRALREHGVTVIGSTSKRAALTQADHVVVLLAGEAVAQGTWRELEDRWGHLAG